MYVHKISIVYHWRKNRKLKMSHLNAGKDLILRISGRELYNKLDTGQQVSYGNNLLNIYFVLPNE